MSKDYLHDFLNWVSYNRGAAVGVVASIAVSIYMLGCEPQTVSILDPSKKVTACQLEREIVTIESDYAEKVKIAELAKKDLEEQFAFRAKLVELAGGVGNIVASGTPSTGGVVGSLVQIISLIGAGALFYDNRRKDALLKKGT